MRLLICSLAVAAAVLPNTEKQAMGDICDSFPALGCPTNHRTRGDYCSMLTAFITCSVAGSSDTVSELKLEKAPAGKLAGTIPNSIGSLSGLKKFHARDNLIFGSIPASLSQTVIFDLDLSDNSLSGTIPDSLGNLPLISVELDANNLDGSVPATLFQSKLQNLNLRGNDLRGSIPPAVKNAVKLNFLKLSDNNFEGTIPTEIGQLTELFELLLDGNQLRGNVPSEVGRLQNLATFTTHANLNISPFFPTELGQMRPARGSYFLFGNNQQSSSQAPGTLPTELGRLTGLVQLVIFESPFLTGTLPTQLGLMSSLHSLWIEDTAIHGTIPTELDRLTGLVSLRLRSNLLSGALPPLNNVFGASASTTQPRQEYWFANNFIAGGVPSFGSQVQFECSNTYMTPVSLCRDPKVCSNNNQESARDAQFSGCISQGSIRGDFIITPATDETCFAEYLVYLGTDSAPVGNSPLFRVPKGPRFDGKLIARNVAVPTSVGFLWVYSGSGNALPQSIQIPPLKFNMVTVQCNPTPTPNNANSASSTRAPSPSPTTSVSVPSETKPTTGGGGGSNGGVIAAAIIVVAVAVVVVALIVYVRRRRQPGRSQLATVHPKEMDMDDDDRRTYPKNPHTYV